jgi:hypothetical protein
VEVDVTRAYGYVIVTAIFIGFWVWVFWPTIALWWVNR